MRVSPGRRQRILFLLKHRDYRYHCDPPYSYSHLSSGLWNSARLVAEMLRDRLGHEVKLVQVRDNNQIDREVTRFRPDVCIIEAYWVVPEKFTVLHRLHPNVTWVVRNHSAMPFANLEGVVMDWSFRYMDHPKVILSCNDMRTDAEFRVLIARYKPEWPLQKLRRRCVLLPNYYPATLHPRCHQFEPQTSNCQYPINISCFGAIRPLKNHLEQAVAAIRFARANNLHLRFHINATRIEQMADPILRNIRALFEHTRYELVEHPWLKHPEFVKLAAKMDIGLNVTFSETFSIGTADLATHSVPVVTSSEVSWVNPLYYAHPTDSVDIATKIKRALIDRTAVKRNIIGLEKFDSWSKQLWEAFLDRIWRQRRARP